jgi:hypothetical protein
MSKIRTMLAAAALLGLMLPAAVAQSEPYGYWSVNNAPDGVKLGLVFPDYSPNEFVGLLFICTPGTQTVSVSADSPQALEAGASAEVEIVAGDRRAAYRGTAEYSEMDDATKIAFTTTLSDPIFDAMAHERTLTVSVQGSAQRWTLDGAEKAFAEFQNICRAGQ